MKNRHDLPSRRRVWTTTVRTGSQTAHVSVGLDEKRRVREMFVVVSKAGTDVREVLDAFARAISLGLQYEVPVQAYIDQLRSYRSDMLNAVANVLDRERKGETR